MAKEKLQIILDAIWKGGRSVKKAEKDLGGLNKGVEKAQANWKKLAGGAGLAGIAIAGMGIAAKQAFAELERGAELSANAQKFDNLTQSIGSTSDAMLGRMNAASKNMVSNADLISGATTIMQGKLAKTEDSVVRMSAVTGALGWDMGVLAQTINNQSILRLDNLGLAVEDVIPRFKELKETMGDKEAFGLAVIEAGEASLELMGDRSETTAGQIDQMKKAYTDARDAFSIGFAEGAAEEVRLIGENAELSAQAFERAGQFWGNTAATIVTDIFTVDVALQELDNAYKQGSISQAEYIANAAAVQQRSQSVGATLAFVSGKQEELAAATGEAVFSFAALTRGVAQADTVMLRYTNSAGAAASASRRLAFAPFGPFQAADTRKTKVFGASALTDLGDEFGPQSAQTSLAKSTAALNETNNALEEGDNLAGQFFGGVASGALSAADAMAELNAQTGSLFDQALNAKDFDPAQFFYEQALAAGASADQLREALIGTGLKSVEEADEVAQRFAQMQNLIAGAQSFVGGATIDQAFAGGQGLAAADFSGSTVDQSSTVNVGGVSVIIQGSATGEDIEMAIDNAFAKVADSQGAAP